MCVFAFVLEDAILIIIIIIISIFNVFINLEIADEASCLNEGDVHFSP